MSGVIKDAPVITETKNKKKRLIFDADHDVTVPLIELEPELSDVKVLMSLKDAQSANI